MRVVVICRKQLHYIKTDFRKYPVPIIAQSILDNFAWISFAYATLYLPLGIATTISEGYLIFGAILGILINHERFRAHQYAGITLTVFQRSPAQLV